MCSTKSLSRKQSPKLQSAAETIKIGNQSVLLSVPPRRAFSSGGAEKCNFLGMVGHRRRKMGKCIWLCGWGALGLWRVDEIWASSRWSDKCPGWTNDRGRGGVNPMNRPTQLHSDGPSWCFGTYWWYECPHHRSAVPPHMPAYPPSSGCGPGYTA